METFFSILQTVLIALFVYVVVWYLIGLLLRRNDVVDIAWGPGIALVAGVALYAGNVFTLQSSILLLLVVVWALRLAVRVGLRVFRHTEDARYAAWRNEWKYVRLRSFFQVYVLQGLLMVVLAYPFIHYAVWGKEVPFVLFTAGVLVWCVGFLFEMVSDYQLARFLKTRKDSTAVLETGLWRYSRHPNYFGEVLCWWGVWLAIVALPYGVFAVVSPLAITLLILFVSGVPMLEKGMMQNPAYRAYAARTSVFVPMAPKPQ